MVTLTHATKALLTLLIVLLSIHYAGAQVRIEAALYDPIGTEAGGEFVLLRNYGTSSIDISGWTIATASSDRDVTFASGTTLHGGMTYLIADVGWNTSKDNASWPTAHLEDTITLGNSNSGLALISNGTLIDALGWGNPTDTRFYHIEPAPHVNASGQILLRRSLIGNTSADFIIGDPFALSAPSQDRIPIEVTIVSPVLVIRDVLIAGSHNASIIPIPGQTLRVPVLANLSEGTVNATVTFTGSHTTMTKNGSLWQSSLDIPYSLGPGSYQITITTSSTGTSITGTSELTIQPVLAYEIQNGTASFGRLSPGHTGFPSLRPALRNIGNVPLDIILSSTDLRASSSTIPAGRIALRDGGDILTLDSEQPLAIGLGPTQHYLLDLLIEVPASTLADTYRGSILLRGVRS